jgi:hypothetical protein
MASFVYLVNTHGAEIGVNPEKVILLEDAGGGATKVWTQRSDDESGRGNFIEVRGDLRSVAEDLTTY